MESLTPYFGNVLHLWGGLTGCKPKGIYCYMNLSIDRQIITTCKKRRRNIVSYTYIQEGSITLWIHIGRIMHLLHSVCARSFLYVGVRALPLLRNRFCARSLLHVSVRSYEVLRSRCKIALLCRRRKRDGCPPIYIALPRG